MDAVPIDPNFVCVGCRREHTPATAANLVRFGDFQFCSVECERRWILYGSPVEK